MRFKVEASITNKIRKFCIYLGGVIAGDYLTCKEKTTLNENTITLQINECGNCYEFWSINLGLHIVDMA